MPAKVTLVGHPFAPIGMGELLRAAFRSMRSVGVDVWVRDAWGGNSSDPSMTQHADEELRARLVPRLDSEISIFTVNGDEREPIFRHLGADLQGAGFRIGYPAWELPKYPEAWARELEHYQEIWGFSAFLTESLKGSVRRPVTWMPLPCRPVLRQQYSRRHFGISESAYVFLFFFDLSSYLERKNPYALLRALAKVREARPFADLQVVMKLGSSHLDPAATARFLEALEPFRRHVLLIDRSLSNDEVKSLVRVGDAYVSLHRSEGFGFSPGEAMYFGKPVIATGYSGNMDYMTPETARLVDYRLIPVQPGQYPHAEGQVWADPDVDQAAAHMIALLDDPGAGRALGALASAHVRTKVSHRACGLRYQRRLDEISSELAAGRP
jgi:glycosyltransferase involved in cell wall biosynthesis